MISLRKIVVLTSTMRSKRTGAGVETRDNRERAREEERREAGEGHGERRASSQTLDRIRGIGEGNPTGHGERAKRGEERREERGEERRGEERKGGGGEGREHPDDERQTQIIKSL